MRSIGGAALLLVAACTPAVLDPRGPVGAAEKTILIDSLVIMLAIVVPTIAATFGFAWWYRASNTRARHRPDWAFSGKVELVVWAIPCMVIILLGGVAWIGSHDLDPAKPLVSDTPTLEVQVVSLDWKWLFIYPAQGVASVNELVFPAATPVRFRLTSASVMNAFFIPQLGSMIYTMNGMTTTLHLQADAPGTFAGLSSHFSGEGFSDMHFEARAVDAKAFEAWVAAARAESKPLDEKRYAELSRQSIKAPVEHFSTVDPALFDKIVMLTVPPSPGPGPAVPTAATTQSTEP